jgi:transposase InsO family protein
MILSKDQEDLLDKLYYQDGFTVGRDRLYAYVSENYPDLKISRRQVMQYLQSQETHQLYAPAMRTVDIRSTVLKEPHSQIGIDLIDMSKNEYNGYKWILTGYDLFSKMSYAVPLKNKETESVTSAMKKLIETEIHHVDSIRSDNGSEFISKEFKNMLEKKNIKQVLSLPSKPQSNGGIERLNKTLKRYLKTQMYMNDTNDWVQFVPVFTHVYNSTSHDVTGQDPNKLNEETDKKKLKNIKEKIVERVSTKNNSDEQKFDIGDNVRRKLDDDEKTDGQNWSRNVYTIYDVEKPKKKSLSSYAYLIEDKKDQYTKKYYANDLLKVIDIKNKVNRSERYQISRLIKPVVRDKKPAYIVRWKGFKEKDDTVEFREQLMEDVPKLVRKYEKENVVYW